jgi:hypothetical protein
MDRDAGEWRAIAAQIVLRPGFKPSGQPPCMVWENLIIYHIYFPFQWILFPERILYTTVKFRKSGFGRTPVRTEGEGAGRGPLPNAGLACSYSLELKH